MAFRSLSLDEVLAGEARLDATHALVAVPLGTIELATGTVVACDPLSGFTEPPPFLVTFAPGDYEASLRIVRFDTAPPQVIFHDVAQLVIARPAARCATWELALAEGDERPTRAGQFPGIRVESATAALCDLAVRDLFADDATYERLRAAKRTAPGGALASAAPGGAAIFAVAGTGADGSFPAFFGRDAAGVPNALVLDFRMVPVVKPPVLSTAELAARVVAVADELAGEDPEVLGLAVDEAGVLAAAPLVMPLERVLARAQAGTLRANGFLALADRAARALAGFAAADPALAAKYRRYLTAGDTGGVELARAVLGELEP